MHGQFARMRYTELRSLFKPTLAGAIVALVLGIGGVEAVSQLSGSASPVNAPLPVPLDAELPLGSLIHTKTVSDSFGAVSEVDTFTFDVDADQTITLRLSPQDASIQGQIDLLDPTSALLGSASASTAGETVILQTVSMTQTGTYTIDLTSLAGTGAYELGVVLNAALESEAYGGAANGSIITAQGINASAVALTDTAYRLAVLGEAELGGDDYYSFAMDAGEAASLALKSLGVSDVELELRNSSDVVLARGVVEASNVNEYIDGYVAPSVAIFYARVSGSTTDTQYSLVVIRGARFNLEPNEGASNARDISASGQALGYLEPSVTEDFESGGLSGAWTTYTSGILPRIQVTGDYGTASGSYALLMDTNSGFSGYFSLEEATWTVSLSDVSSPTLSFYAATWNDQLHTLPLDFTGHYNGDGIAISDDGTNWHRVFNPPF